MPRDETPPAGISRSSRTPPPQKSPNMAKQRASPGVWPSAAEKRAVDRCAKLRALMAPSDAHPYGHSSNALATELGVHLTVFIQFLNNGGLSQKVDLQTGEYTTAHLRLLAEWIDEQPEPVRFFQTRIH
jgi:hypothetical protein